jgi:adenylate cyclase
LTIAHETLGIALIYSGRAREGLAALQRYVRLDPRDPTLALGLLQIAIGHYFCREYETALDAAERVIRSYPDYQGRHVHQRHVRPDAGAVIGTQPLCRLR